MVRQMRWHPASDGHDHLLVLTSENTLRLYHRARSETLAVFRLGGGGGEGYVSESSIGLSKSVSTLVSLGCTAVDFDFTPPQLKGGENSKGIWPLTGELEWPILVLYGNGDVYSITPWLDKKKAKITGPLCVKPGMPDNYETDDACSIAVLHGTPAVVAVAYANGIVYHSMLLDKNPDAVAAAADERADSLLADSEWCLYTFECVELELGLAFSLDCDLYSCPLVLHKDPNVVSRYFCAHDGGLHCVNVPAMTALEAYAKGPWFEETDAADLPSLMKYPSVLEYLMCTRLNTPETKTQPPHPPLGLAVCDHPVSALLCLPADGDVALLAISRVPLLLKSRLEMKYDDFRMDEGDDAPESPKTSFMDVIADIFKPGGTFPLLKLPQDENLSEETVAKLAKKQMVELREHHLNRVETAVKEIETRAKSFEIREKRFSEDLKEMRGKLKEAEAKSKKLNETYEELSQSQRRINDRCENLSYKLKRIQPRSATIEKKLKDKLNVFDGKVDKLEKLLEGISLKLEYQEKLANEKNEDIQQRSTLLSANQQKIITEQLSHTGSSIEELKKRVKAVLKEEIVGDN